MRDKILTARDLLDFLINESESDPDFLDYQVAKYDYDDFAVGFTGFTFGCKRISVCDLPVEEDMDGVDDALVTKKILMID
jgi:hypothetical protein